MRILTSIFLLFTSLAYSQVIHNNPINPPLGLEFGMSKSSFLIRMYPRFKESGEKKYTETDTTVTFTNIKFGTGAAQEFVGQFYQNQLFRVRVNVNKKMQEEMFDLFTSKYGKPYEVFEYTWLGRKNHIELVSYTDHGEFTYINRMLEKAYYKKSRDAYQRKIKDY